MSRRDELEDTRRVLGQALNERDALISELRRERDAARAHAECLEAALERVRGLQRYADLDVCGDFPDRDDGAWMLAADVLAALEDKGGDHG